MGMVQDSRRRIREQKRPSSDLIREFKMGGRPSQYIPNLMEKEVCYRFMIFGEYVCGVTQASRGVG